MGPSLLATKENCFVASCEVITEVKRAVSGQVIGIGAITGVTWWVWGSSPLLCGANGPALRSSFMMPHIGGLTSLTFFILLLFPFCSSFWFQFLVHVELVLISFCENIPLTSGTRSIVRLKVKDH